MTGSGLWFRVALAVILVLSALPLWAGTNTWTNIGPDGGNVYTLGIDPQHSGTVYASADNGLFKTIDGGANWGMAEAGPSAPALVLAIAPKNPAFRYS